MAKSILYTLSTGEFVIDDQFTGENNATTITIDYSDCEVDTWSKYLDIRLPDGSGAPLFLGSDITVTLELDASFTAFKGKIEIQPYAIEAVTSNKILWDIKPITIQRSLSVAEDDIAYDPTAMQQLLDAIATMQAKINLIYTDYEAGVFNASVDVGATTTGDAGTEALVENIGTPEAAILNFTIPQGIQGIQGIKGDSITNITSEKVDDTTTITITGTFPGSPYVFTVDDGIDGIDGTNVESVTSNKVGTTTTVTITGTFTGSPYEFTIEDGYTPIKDVDYFDGEDGYTPIKGVDYFDGEDGYTPIKDVDYFDGLDGTNISSVTSNKVGKTTTVTVDGDFVGAPHTFDIEDGLDGTGAGDMLSTNNLSDVADVPTSRTNLGLGTTDDVEFGSVKLNGGTGTQGTFSWNADKQTVDLVQNGTTLQLGQEFQYPTINQTGFTIGNAVVVASVGALGASGKLLIAPWDASTMAVHDIIGITTEVLPNGGEGKVTKDGEVNDVQTSNILGTNTNNVIYADTANPGGLTYDKPTDYIVPLAFLITDETAPATANGRIMVRATQINELDLEKGVTAFSWGDWSAQIGVTIQAQLVNQTNIKSINGASILGSGDLEVTGGQMLGTAVVKAIAYNAQTIAENITIPATYNAMSVGTITIEDGYTVTLEDGAVWFII